jgi:methyl-accepting chemotaxis protein
MEGRAAGARPLWNTRLNWYRNNPDRKGKRMKNWKIGIRITAGFAASAAITLALGVFAYHQIERINKSSLDVSANSMPSIELMARVHSNAWEAETLLLQHILSTNKEEMAKLDAQISANRSGNEQLLVRYEKDLISNDEDRRLLGLLNSARINFSNAAEETLKVSRLGTAEGNRRAMAMLQTQVMPTHAKYLEATENEVTFNQDLGATAAKLVDTTVSSARAGLLAGMGIAFGIAIIVSLLIVKSITSPLKGAVGLAERVAEGDLTEKAQVDSTGELGQMIRAMNAMVDNLQAAAHVAERLAEGDLTVDAHALSEKDVLGKLSFAC